MNKILILQQIPGMGLIKIKRFIRNLGIYFDDTDYFDYTLYQVSGHRASDFYDQVKKIEDDCKELDIKIITDIKFDIPDTPLLLYLKGDSDILNSSRLIGVVGTRNPSLAGKKLGRDIVTHIADESWVVVSGMAIGCDKIAHYTAIENGGKTVAVIPMGHKKNFGKIIEENGAVISEYPPYSPLEKYKCIHRNRIISGLVKGLFVIETHSFSGSEHTIKYAIRGKKDVCYGIGYKGIEKYSSNQIRTRNDIVSFLNKIEKA